MDAKRARSPSSKVVSRKRHSPAGVTPSKPMSTQTKVAPFFSSTTKPFTPLKAGGFLDELPVVTPSKDFVFITPRKGEPLEVYPESGSTQDSRVKDYLLAPRADKRRQESPDVRVWSEVQAQHFELLAGAGQELL